MLNALIYGKLGSRFEVGAEAQTWRDVYQGCEDFLTATIFERLTYLPPDLSWGLLSDSIITARIIPQESGSLKNVEFWPRWPLPHGGSREPDVLLSFNNFDLIVEAKRSDNYDMQDVVQLAEERLAYRVAGLEENSREVYVLGVGGLYSPTPDITSNIEKKATDYLLENYSVDIDFKFFFIPWQNILISTENRLATIDGSLSNENHIRNVLFDIREALLLNQIAFVQYLSTFNNDVEDFRPISIDSINYLSGVKPKTEWDESVSIIGHIDDKSMAFFTDEVAELEWYVRILSLGQIKPTSLDYMREHENE